MNIETVRQIVRQESPSRIFGGTVVSADPRGTRTATVRDNGGHVHSRVRTCTEDLGVGDQVVVARLAGMDRLVVLGKIASPHGSSLSTMGVLAPPSNFSVLAWPAMVYAQWDTYPGECLSWEIQYSLNGSPYADAAQVLVSRGSYYLYPCDPGTTVYMRARAVRWIGDNNLMRSAWTAWASASAADYEVPNLIIDLTNKSGGARIATEVVVVDTTTDESFTTTVAVGDLGVIGVVMESIANNAIGQVCISGLCQILIDNAVTRGHYLQASATAGRADGSAARAEGSFARALESGVQDDTIWAVISLTLSGNAIVSASLVEVEEIGTATYDDVQDWINNTQSAGRITGGAVTAHAYPITGVTAGGAGAGEFETAGDHTAAFGAGVILTVSGSTGNDGDYTVSAGGATHAGGTTTIPVDEAVPNAVADGNIAAGTVGVASGTGFIKDADSDTATTYSFDWAATTTPLIPTNDTSNWVYLDYNGGSPVVGITDDHGIITRNDTFVLDRLWREDSTLYIVGKGQNVYNLSMRTHRNLTRVFHFQRGNGVKLTEKGTRKVGVSAGNLYRGLNEIPIAAIDTSGADTFTTLYRDGGGGWTQVTGQTTIDNANYDDGSGVLQGIVNNQYGVYWAYLDYAGDLHIQYGQGSYHLAEAEAAQFPVTRTFLDKFAMLIAKIVVKEGALENFYGIEYPWDVRFVAAPVANHNNLGGLQGGTAGEYYHFTQAQHASLTTVAAAGYALVSDGVDSWVADQTPAWTGEHSFGAGIAFTGASGVNEVTVPDDTAIALELLDAGGLEYFRVNSADANPYFLIDPAGAGIKVAIGVAVPNQALTVEGTIDLKEQAAANADVAAYGQIWVKNTVPNELWFTDDAGNDAQLGLGASGLPNVAGAGYALVSDGVNSWIADQTPAWTGEHSFAAGVAFTGASGANEITVPDNIAIALELLDAGGLEYMRVVSTDANPYFLIDPAAAGIKVGIGITPTAPLTVQADTSAFGIRVVGRGDDFGLLQFFENDGVTLEGVLTGYAGRLTVSGPGATNDLTIVANGSVGIATLAIPHGGVGYAKFAIEGTNASAAGPHVQFTTASDDYPLIQILPWQHDDVILYFDAYWDGANRSSDAGSNARIRKGGDKLIFAYDSGVAQGAVVTWNDGIVLNLVTGDVGIGCTPTVRFDVFDDYGGFVGRFVNDGNDNNRQGIIIQCGLDTNPAARLINFGDGNGTTIGYVIGNGAGGVTYFSSSDERNKNILGPVEGGLKTLGGLTPIRYVGKGLTAETGRRCLGFSAQDVQRCIPEAVRYDEEEDQYKLNQVGLVPVLVKAVQELNERIEQLEVM